jgi:hypothetical protein
VVVITKVFAGSPTLLRQLRTRRLGGRWDQDAIPTYRSGLLTPDS